MITGKDTMGRWVTSGFFKETAGENKSFVAMTIEEARTRFIKCNDMFGIDFADKYLGGFQHWKAIQASPVMQPYVAEWKEELELRLRSLQLKRIASLSDEGQFQAAKFLMDRGWEKRSAGKPSKDEVARETRVQSNMAKDFKADFARIKR